MKKIFVLMLCCIILFTGCTNITEEKLAYKAGIYLGTATGFNGTISVEVTVDESEIKEIKLIEFNDTVMVGDMAFETISKEVIEHQSLNIDFVSGATISSAGVKTAIKDALSKSEVNIEILEKKEIKKETPKELAWETDVLVIGSGLAGMSAAVEAAENGAQVIMIEKLGRLGGTSALSAGWVHAAGTVIQNKLDIQDSTEQFYTDWMNLVEKANDQYVEPEMVRLVTDNSSKNIDWLMDHGVKMMDNLMAAGIYQGRNIPRIHMTEGGKGYISKFMLEATEKAGVKTYVNTPATELIKEGNIIVGAKAKDKDGNIITIKAKAVIVASGGFAANKELMTKYYPQYTDYQNSSVNKGDSLMFAESVGADIIVKNALQLHHNLAEDTSLGYFTPECIYVTPEGDRFVDEAEYFYTRTRVLRDLGFGDTHMIVPQALYEKHKVGIDKAIDNKKAFKAGTIEELANLMNMDVKKLENTINRYNELVEKGIDEDFNKASNYLLKIEAPYIGLDLTGNLNDTYVSMRINTNAQVIGNNGEIINGLYAAGATASAQTLNQEYIGSGSALLNGLTFGRIAGAHAAKNLSK